MDLDITVIANGSSPNVAFGAELAALAEALTTNTVDSPVAARTALATLADDRVAERAIGVVATFQMMNRLLDGVGAPIHPRLHPLAIELGFAPSDIPR